MPNAVYIHALRRAADVMGGAHQLRAYLRVSIYQLQAWMGGAETPPTDVFLKVVDIISGPGADVADLLRQSKELRSKADEIVSTAQAARQRAAEAIERAGNAQRRSLKLRAALLAARIAPAARCPQISAAEFVATEFSASEGALVVESALNAALNGTAATRANIQLADGAGLYIVAHLGFRNPFLEFFAAVRHETASACGRAYERAERIIVTDVATDPIFAGTPARDVMLDADARACQSTPLLGGSGEVIAVLSTHYDEPHRPSSQELSTLDLIGERTSFWLAGHGPLAH